MPAYHEFLTNKGGLAKAAGTRQRAKTERITPVSTAAESPLTEEKIAVLPPSEGPIEPEREERLCIKTPRRWRTLPVKSVHFEAMCPAFAVENEQHEYVRTVVLRRVKARARVGN